MNFYLIGVDYKSAPSEIRQKICRRRSQIENFWRNMAALDSALLVTCNRFDISIAGRYEKEIVAGLELFKKEFPEFYAYSYAKEGALKVLRYGLRLACGLESQLKGEIQILEQLKVWLKQDNFPESLLEFWSRIIREASSIRIKSGVNSDEINIARFLFADIGNLGLAKDRLELAVVGTGKVAGLIAEYRPDNVCFSFVAHKNRIKAEALASRVNAKVLTLSQLKAIIPDIHVLVSAALSPHIILRSEDIPDSALNRDKPLYIYDLGFPMNVAKEFKYRNNIVLKNLDDLLFSQRDIKNKVYGNFNLAEYLIDEAVKEIADVKSRHAAQCVSD